MENNFLLTSTLIFLFLSISNSNAQNIISNPGFELIVSGKSIDCQYFQKPVQDFEAIVDWMPPIPICGPPGSSDVLCNSNTYNYISRSGNNFGHCVRTEYLINKLSNKLDKNKYYYIEYWVNCQGSVPNAGLNFYRTRPSQCGGINFVANADIKIGSDIEVGKWKKISKYIKPRSEDKNWIALGHFEEKSESAILWDDLRIFADCSDIIRFENTTFSNESYTFQANDKILVGENVDPSVIDGPVNVEKNSKIIFRAKNTIDIQSINVDNTSEIEINIGDCSDLCPAPRIDFFPNVFSPNSDGSNDLLCFKVAGAIEYAIKVKSYEIQGPMFYESNGMVNGNTICIWNGLKNDGTKCPNGNYEVLLELKNNCGEKIYKSQIVLLLN